MPIEAHVDGLGILEFPDDTPDDVIDSTVKREVAALNASRQKQPSILDTANATMSPTALAQMAQQGTGISKAGELAAKAFEPFPVVKRAAKALEIDPEIADFAWGPEHPYLRAAAQTAIGAANSVEDLAATALGSPGGLALTLVNPALGAASRAGKISAAGAKAAAKAINVGVAAPAAVQALANIPATVEAARDPNVSPYDYTKQLLGQEVAPLAIAGLAAHSLRAPKPPVGWKAELDRLAEEETLGPRPVDQPGWTARADELARESMDPRNPAADILPNASATLAEIARRTAKVKQVQSVKAPLEAVEAVSPEAIKAAQDEVARTADEALANATRGPYRIVEPGETPLRPDAEIEPATAIQGREEKPGFLQSAEDKFQIASQFSKDIMAEDTKAGVSPDRADAIINWLRSKKIDVLNNAFDATGAIPSVVYNLAIDGTIAAVKGGALAADAIEAGVKAAKEKYKDIDEVKLRAALVNGLREIAPKATQGEPQQQKTPPTGSHQVGQAWQRLMAQVGRDGMEEIVSNFRGAELSEDGSKIINRDVRGGGGKWTETKGDFFKWLFSDEPTDPNKFIQEKAWVDQIQKARDAALGKAATPQQPAQQAPAATQAAASAPTATQTPSAAVPPATAPATQPAAIPPAPPQAAAAAPPAAPRGPLKGYAEAAQVFEPPPKPPKDWGQKLKDWMEAARTHFLTSKRPLGRVEENILKENPTVPKPAEDLAARAELLKGVGGQAHADVYRFDRDVSDKLHPVDIEPFNIYMFANRVISRLTDDPAIKRVNGWGIPDAQNTLKELEQRVGTQRFQEYQDIAEKFQQHTDEALWRQVESGRMSRESYNAIKAHNDFYAKFAVLKHLEDDGARAPGTGNSIDTKAKLTQAITGIDDPDFKLGNIVEAARNQIELSRVLAEKNRVMQEVAKTLDYDSNNSFSRRLAPGEAPRKGWEAVSAFFDGKERRYEVEPTVAQAVKTAGSMQGDPGVRVVTGFLRAAATGMRAGATGLSLVFNAVNKPYDVWRLATSSTLGPKLTPLDMGKFIWQNAKGLYDALALNFGHATDGALAYLDSGAAQATMQSAISPESLKLPKPDVLKTWKDKARFLVEALPRLSNAVEESTKITAIARAMEKGQVTRGEDLLRWFPELVTEVRRYGGSPDFGRVGETMKFLNVLMPFVNARTQGTIADIARLVGHDGAKPAAAMAAKLATGVVIPTAVLWAYNHSTPQLAAEYDKLSDREKENYWLIPKLGLPTITNERGEKMVDYWRIPKREVFQMTGNTIEQAMEFAKNKSMKGFPEFTANLVDNLLPISMQGRTAQERMESGISGLNPGVKLPFEVALNRNTWLHQPIIPDRMKGAATPQLQYDDRTSPLYVWAAKQMPDMAPDLLKSPKMLEHIMDGLTSNLVSQFVDVALPKTSVEGRSKLENFAWFKRFQRSPYVDDADNRDMIEHLKGEAVDESILTDRAARSIVRENLAKGPQAIYQATMKAFGPADPQHPTGEEEKSLEKGLTRVVELVKSQAKGVDPTDKLVLGLPPKQRAEYIAVQLAKAPDGPAKVQYLQAAHDKGLLSDQTLEHLAFLVESAKRATGQPKP